MWSGQNVKPRMNSVFKDTTQKTRSRKTNDLSGPGILSHVSSSAAWSLVPF